MRQQTLKRAMLGACAVCVSLLAHKMSRDLDEFLVAPRFVGALVKPSVSENK